MAGQNTSRLGEWLVLLGFAAVVGLVFQQIATSLADQGAASGDPLANAAMFPRIVGWLMAGLIAMIGAAMLAGHMARPGEHHTADAMPDLPPEPETVRRRMLLGMIAVLVIYLIAVVPLGFHLSTSAAMATMFAVLGVRPWWRAIAAGVFADLVIGFVFEVVLNVVLPAGVFGLSLPVGLL